MDDRPHTRIESAGIWGFRSLADVNVEDLLPVAVLGANGSGKFNVMRFFSSARTAGSVRTLAVRWTE